MSFSAFVDGFNLYKSLLVNSPQNKWLDLRRLSQSYCPGLEAKDIFYFTAHLKNKYVGDTSNERQHTYLRALEADGVKVVAGHFDVRPVWKPIYSKSIPNFTKPKLPNILGIPSFGLSQIWKKEWPNPPIVQISQFREKGSDVNLASYFLRELYLNNVMNLLVITGDSDLMQPIRMAEEHGAKVKVLVPNNRRGNVFNKFASEFKDVVRISSEELGEFQFPNPIIAEYGKQIFKPKEWN